MRRRRSEGLPRISRIEKANTLNDVKGGKAGGEVAPVI